MATKFQEMAEVISQEQLGDGIFSLWIKTNDIAKYSVPGQFVSLFSANGENILPRPISICEVSDDKTSLRLVYRVVGKGTNEFSKLINNDKIKVLGPLGNGYTLKNKSAMLIAGGIGVPPIVELAKQLKSSGVEDIKAVVGYRDELFLKEELEKYCEVFIATEDGSFGVKGNVIDAINEHNLSADIIYSCGPKPMLKAVSEFAQKHGIEAQISLEERMACGIGACLACVCKTKEKDEHSNVNNTRICADGPVFDSREVEL